MEKENSFFTRLKEKIKKHDGFEFIDQMRFYSQKGSSLIDLAILKDKDFFIALFFNEKIGDPLVELNYIYPINSKYVVLTNGETFLVYRNEGLVINLEKTIGSIDEFIQIVFIDEPNDETKSKIKDLITATTKISSDIFKDTDSQKMIPLLSEENLRGKVEYNSNGGYFQFVTDFEFELFDTYLDGLPEKSLVYRYTSLDGGFQTIKNKSIRMNGLPGMNDISEVGYVESYIYNSNVYEFWNDTNSIINIEDINKRYIACCSTLDDELNTWRIYGDAAKGTALVFEVGKSTLSDKYILKKIKYGKNVVGKNFDPLLEFLKQLNSIIGIGPVRIKNFQIWKHFFKSYEYENEKEVRLLHIVDDLPDSWNLTFSHSILNPSIFVDLNNEELPIKLKKIILGPICPEKYVNKRQFEVFKNKVGLTIDIELSKILSYR